MVFDRDNPGSLFVYFWIFCFKKLAGLKLLSLFDYSIKLKIILFFGTENLRNYLKFFKGNCSWQACISKNYRYLEHWLSFCKFWVYRFTFSFFSVSKRIKNDMLHLNKIICFKNQQLIVMAFLITLVSRYKYFFL